MKVLHKVAILLVTLSIFLISVPESLAINVSKSVNYLKADLIQYGEVRAVKKADSRLDKVEIILYLPQKDTRQKINIIDVYPQDYQILKDEYGNEKLKLIWTNPGDEMKYRVKTRVEVASNPVLGEYNPVFVKETEMTRSNREMVEKSLEFRGEHFNRLAELAIWINENVVYDKTFENETKSAEWVFENRRGVCDEFSNLFVSLARAQSFSTRYVAGLVYSQDFIPHAWAEVFLDGRWVGFDPTWAEAGYIDATHIKLANLVDGNFSESIYVEGYNTDVNWSTTRYNFTVLEEREESPIEVQTRLINKEIGLGYSIFKANLGAEQCLIAGVNLGSCKYNDYTAFEIFDQRKDLVVCNSSDTFWLARYRGVGLKKDLMYTCPLILSSDFGDSSREEVLVDPSKQMEEFDVLQDKVFAVPRQKFNVSVNARESISLFSLYFDKLNGVSFKGRKDFEFTAPDIPGKYKVWFVGSDGYGKSVDLEVVRQKLISVYNIKAPNSVTQGDSFLVDVTFKSLTDKHLDGNLTFVAEETITKPFSLNPYQADMGRFNTSLQSIGKHQLKLIFDLKDDYDVSVLEVDVLQKETSFFEALLEYIAKAINSILSIFKR